MKIFTLCALIFCINIGTILTYNMHLFTGMSVSGEPGQISTVQSFANKSYGSLIRDNDGRTTTESDYVKSLGWFEQLKAIMLPHYTLNLLFGIPIAIAILISAPIYLIYFIAIIQFVRNFSGEGGL